MTLRPLASQPGLESNPSISPDGRWISCLYRAHSNDRPQFQVHATQGGPPVSIDTGELAVEQSAAWSPDSNDLAFVGLDRSGKRSLYKTPRTGGSVSRIAPCLSATGCDLDWSPDGRRSRCHRSLTRAISTNCSSSTLQPARRSLLRASRWVYSPRFSPDGRWIAFNQQVSFTGDDVCMVPSSGGAVHCATRHPWWLGGFA